MRNMASNEKIMLVFGNIRVTAQLLWEEAPKTCASIWDALPLEGTVNHARLAGDELMFPTRIYIDPENQSKAQKTGNISYWPDRMSICIFYGPTEGVGLTNVFAKVTSDIEVLKSIGDDIWKRQGKRMRIERGEVK